MCKNLTPEQIEKAKASRLKHNRNYKKNHPDIVRACNQRYLSKHPEIYISYAMQSLDFFDNRMQPTYIERTERQMGSLPLYDQPPEISEFIRKHVSFSEDY